MRFTEVLCYILNVVRLNIAILLVSIVVRVSKIGFCETRAVLDSVQATFCYPQALTCTSTGGVE